MMQHSLKIPLVLFYSSLEMMFPLQATAMCSWHAIDAFVSHKLSVRANEPAERILVS